MKTKNRIMKKIYLTPALQVISVNTTSSMLTVSVDTSKAEDYTGGGTITGTKGNNVGNIWDDDDE